MKANAARASIRLGDLPELDLSGLEQLVEHSQTRAICEALQHLGSTALSSGEAPIDSVLEALEAAIASGGLDVLRPQWKLGNLAKPRMLEVHAALSRLRSLNVATSKPPAANGGKNRA